MTPENETTNAAGVNAAPVNYQFGGKSNLFLEVLRCKFTAMAEHKRQSLQSVIDNQPTPDLKELISTYVGLFIGDEQTAAYTRRFLQLVSRDLSDDSDAMELLLQQQRMLPVHQLMKRTISTSRPSLSEVKISLCISSIVGQVFHFVRCLELMRTLAGRDSGGDWLSDIWRSTGAGFVPPLMDGRRGTLSCSSSHFFRPQIAYA